MKQQKRELPLVPPEILSPQQKQIYQLHSRGLSNKEIATELNINQGSVATQLSRIKKKAQALGYIYKIGPGAEHAQNSITQYSPAGELKKKIRDDPGFFKLMFNKYASNHEFSQEDKYRLASAGQESTLLLNTRAKSLRTMTITGRDANSTKMAIKISKKDRLLFRDYLQNQNIKPVQVYWDDGSAVYLVTSRDIENMRQLLNSHNDIDN